MDVWRKFYIGSNYACHLLLLSSLLGRTFAAPQGVPLCNIPVNPAAAIIGEEFLEVPGCNGQDRPVVTLGTSTPLSATSVTSSATLDISSSTALPVPANPPSLSSTPASGSKQPSTQSSTSENNTESSSASSSDSSSNSGTNIGQLYQSSVTRYGQGPPGTPGTDQHCQAHQGACGNNPQSGWTATASQFLYFNGGAGVGGSACGTCWRVTGATDSAHVPLSTTPTVVMITNECAAQLPGQEVNLCGMSSLSETNALGATVNIDLCMDSGASQAFFGAPPWGTAIGTAQQVDCASEWCGTWADGTKSGPAGCSAPGADYPDTT
ncbi:MAG: hypothetical protein M4579_000264 [Chaenotheca gracillima]|nr:MAG: hypothetical protein M4579_000264 [Chaenotheca gracillima]